MLGLHSPGSAKAGVVWNGN